MYKKISVNHEETKVSTSENLLWPFREVIFNFECVNVCMCVQVLWSRFDCQDQANGEAELGDREEQDAPLCLLLTKRHVNGRDMRGCAQG